MTPRRAQYLSETGRHEQLAAERREARRNPPQRRLPWRIQQIFNECAAANNITVAEMIRGPQTRRATEAKRQAARQMNKFGFSLNETARFVNRHHTTVLYWLKGRPVKRWRPIEIPIPDLSGEWI